MSVMHQLLDVARYPLHRPESDAYGALVADCRRALAAEGLFSLEGLLRPEALRDAVVEISPVLETAAFTHKREHNIYFTDDAPGIAADHPALKRFETINHTICADQIQDSILCRLYEWPPLAAFLAAVMRKPRLYPMADELARVNVMGYGTGEALNWHFDRAEFTTTLLLQSPSAGGAFEYRRDLRGPGKPNYAGVAALLAGQDQAVKTLPLAPGTLNVFKGKNTAHRVTPSQGERSRIIAVFSYYEEPNVRFSAPEQRGFYGRTI